MAIDMTPIFTELTILRAHLETLKQVMLTEEQKKQYREAIKGNLDNAFRDLREAYPNPQSDE